MLSRKNYKIKSRKNKGKTEIFDFIRKKYVALTPEELVRQQLLHYLVEEKQFPAGLIGVENSLNVAHGRKLRTDIVVFDEYARPRLLAECKAPNIKISQSVFEQILNYNMVLKAEYLLVSNGLAFYFAKPDYPSGEINYYPEIPDYPEL